MSESRRGFRYRPGGRWFKGNTHLHSTRSDGGMDVADMARMYAGAGYDFLFVTDHNIAFEAGQIRGRPPLLLLGGVELAGNDRTGANYHVVCLGRTKGVATMPDLTLAMSAARSQGALLVLAHPHWTGNSLEDATRHEFDGVEIYNHVCRWLNGKGNGLVHWEAMLARNPATLAFAADDAHLQPEHPGWNGGWIAVNAPRLAPQPILAAIKAGRFYSSCGPRFHSIWHSGSRVQIETSPVKFARLVGPASNGARMGHFGRRRLTTAVFDVSETWPYAYLEIEDDRGRRAWTNTLFLPAGAAAGQYAITCNKPR